MYFNVRILLIDLFWNYTFGAHDEIYSLFPFVFNFIVFFRC